MESSYFGARAVDLSNELPTHGRVTKTPKNAVSVGLKGNQSTNINPTSEQKLIFEAAPRLSAGQLLKIDESLKKIRARAESQQPALEKGPIPENLRVARIRYAALSHNLKSAVRAAAERNKWDPETWEMQINLIAAALLERTATESDLISGYLSKIETHGE